MYRAEVAIVNLLRVYGTVAKPPNQRDFAVFRASQTPSSNRGLESRNVHTRAGDRYVGGYAGSAPIIGHPVYFSRGLLSTTIHRAAAATRRRMLMFCEMLMPVPKTGISSVRMIS